ncbi:hypothetical protein D918_08882 [Trichuris suis]|nr:hypothetical protein D918_08882 [Trichuris suis]
MARPSAKRWLMVTATLTDERRSFRSAFAKVISSKIENGCYFADLTTARHLKFIGSVKLSFGLTGMKKELREKNGEFSIWPSNRAMIDDSF